jgi:ATP-dependent protease ClpP protease subunit
LPRIKVKGVIIDNDDKWIYDYFDVEATCPRDVMKILETLKGEDVEIELSSGGGSVFAGSEIYTALKNYKGRVIIEITGIAASAASVIAMSGAVVKIAPTAQIMIHNVSNIASGDHRDFAHMSEVLKNYNTSIANAYRLKSNLSETELLDMMNKETWLTAQQAKEKGFADEIMFDTGMMLVAGIHSSMIPYEVIQKMRTSKQNPDIKNAEARLSLLRMKGELHV